MNNKTGDSRIERAQHALARFRDSFYTRHDIPIQPTDAVDAVTLALQNPGSPVQPDVTDADLVACAQLLGAARSTTLFHLDYNELIVLTVLRRNAHTFAQIAELLGYQGRNAPALVSARYNRLAAKFPSFDPTHLAETSTDTSTDPS